MSETTFPPGQPSLVWPSLAFLLVASVLFRLPALLNARGVHSDAAVVGLQAMHIMQGEWSWFTWGAGYQASFEALLAALLFSVVGSTPLALMWVPLLGHLFLILFAFDILQRRIAPRLAVLATLVLVLVPDALHRVSLYPPRQWSITCFFCGLWLLDRSGESRWPTLALAAGMFMAMLSLYLDLFVVQFMIGFVAFAVVCALDDRGRGGWQPRRIAGLAIGGGIGLALVWLLRNDPVASDPTIGVAWARVAANFRLLSDSCMPWLLGYKVFVPGESLYPALWIPPSLFRFVQLLGAISIAAVIASAGALLPVRGIPWKVRRLGGFGVLVSISTVSAFLLSSMPADMWAVRYLGPILWVLPFSLAPIAHLLGWRWTGALLTPYLISAAVGGWVVFGPYVDGWRPTRDPRGVAEAEAEAQLGEFLLDRGVHYAAAQYWLAYRLTFLFEEDPVVVPIGSGQNRYTPYLRSYESAPKVALVFHPAEPRAKAAKYEEQLLSGGQTYEKEEVAGFTVLIWKKSPDAPSRSP